LREGFAVSRVFQFEAASRSRGALRLDVQTEIEEDGTVRLRNGLLWVLAASASVLSLSFAVIPAFAAPTGEPPDEVAVRAVNEPGAVVGEYSEEKHHWSPTPATISESGTVAFSNPTSVAHGIDWQVPPGTVTCSAGVPVGTKVSDSGENWSGTCTFSKPGEYKYICTVHGSAMSGVIQVGAPNPTTEAATSVGEEAATLNGTINAHSRETTYLFKYGTTTAYGTTVTVGTIKAGDTADHDVQTPISALKPATTYHYELVARYGGGIPRAEALGGDQTFTTTAKAGSPQATTGEAGAIGEAGATLNGTVNAQGHPTKYFFKYGPTTAYGKTTEPVTVGEDGVDHAAEAALSGLAPGTTYHFELVAENVVATIEGVDQMFTTLSPPPVEPPEEPLPPEEEASPTPPPELSLPPGLSSPPPTATVAAAGSGPQAVASGPSQSPGPSIQTGHPVATIALANTQRGTSVHGALGVPTEDAGAHLQVQLFIRASHGRVLAGRLVRTVSPGRVSFSVALSAQARRLLHRHGSLAVIVKITLTPSHGAVSLMTRNVTVR
jgi:plastocyanin